MTTVYLASPLGFSPEMKDYRDRIKLRLKELDCEVFDPWDQAYGSIIRDARAITDWHDRVAALGKSARDIGRMNEKAIRETDLILGILDGAELDSGTVCEIGFAAGLGKRCYGLRTDFRDLGDFEGLPINLQVLYFIDSSGGRLFRRLEDIEFRGAGNGAILDFDSFVCHRGCSRANVRMTEGLNPRFVSKRSQINSERLSGGGNSRFAYPGMALYSQIITSRAITDVNVSSRAHFSGITQAPTQENHRERRKGA